jgi:hypothetical protein
MTTDEELANQLESAVAKSVQRFSKAKGHSERLNAVAAEFLSGASQVANYLVRADGEATPQQVERALKIVGARMGFRLGPPG